MQRLAKFGHVWKHRKTGKTYGASIDVKTFDELKDYEQVPKQKETQELQEPVRNEETPESEETPYFLPKKRRNE